jgi:hypothetical protein
MAPNNPPKADPTAPASNVATIGQPTPSSARKVYGKQTSHPRLLTTAPTTRPRARHGSRSVGNFRVMLVSKPFRYRLVVPNRNVFESNLANEADQRWPVACAGKIMHFFRHNISPGLVLGAPRRAIGKLSSRPIRALPEAPDLTVFTNLAFGLFQSLFKIGHGG